MKENKVRIGVLSDTHVYGFDRHLKQIVDEHFSDVDLIFHAGDLVDLSVLELFGEKDVKAVFGNMDGRRVREQLPEQLTMDFGGFRVALIHGWGSPAGMERKLADRLGRWIASFSAIRITRSTGKSTAFIFSIRVPRWISGLPNTAASESWKWGLKSTAELSISNSGIQRDRGLNQWKRCVRRGEWSISCVKNRKDACFVKVLFAAKIMFCLTERPALSC